MKDPFLDLRQQMVEEQLANRDIRDQRVLAACQKVPRHKFVPKAYSAKAYQDYPLPIGEEQTISQPYMVALMTQCLGLSGQEKVLEIGTGSGYQTALLAELAQQVYSVERVPALAEKARLVLAELGYRNIEIKAGDGTQGWPQHGPFDAIIVTAGAPDIPAPLIEQLKEGGRLVIPLGGRFTQTLAVVTKNKQGTLRQDWCGCIFVPLVGRYGWGEENAQ